MTSELPARAETFIWAGKKGIRGPAPTDRPNQRGAVLVERGEHLTDDHARRLWAGFSDLIACFDADGTLLQVGAAVKHRELVDSLVDLGAVQMPTPELEADGEETTDPDANADADAARSGDADDVDADAASPEDAADGDDDVEDVQEDAALAVPEDFEYDVPEGFPATLPDDYQALRALATANGVDGNQSKKGLRADLEAVRDGAT